MDMTDRDLVIKARFLFTDDPKNSYWDETIAGDDVKTPCYAFRRGNILFTTIPPPRQPTKTCTSTCKINVADKRERRQSDLCEVCCGIRSPSFSRRAHSFTTHFCTRVPAKKSVSASSSDQRSKSTDSSVASDSSVKSFGNLLSSRGHISRLSAYLKKKTGLDEATSSDYSTSTSSGGDPNTRSGCDKCGLSSASTLALNRSSTLTESSYSSSYPSSCSSYMPFFLDDSYSSSACCDCSGADSVISSFGSLQMNANKDRECDKARFFMNDSSSDSDETCSSEMAWSFGSFCDTKKDADVDRAKNNETRNETKTNRAVMPFVTGLNRKLVTEKFGDIVASLRKPGHHVGPSKNADCLCDNCRSFFCKK